jgi:hypothetical protein
MRYEEFLILTPQAGEFVRGGQALADGTVWGSSLRLLVEFLLECYELYAHRLMLFCSLALQHYVPPAGCCTGCYLISCVRGAIET